MSSFFSRLFPFLKKAPNWEEIEYFNPEWKSRISQMAAFISPGKKVTDLGCGKMWLREFLPANCTYTGVDYQYRGEGSQVCDFNKGEFPSEKTDVFFISGCLEYIRDPLPFIQKVCAGSTEVILSYCVTESFPDKNSRIEHAWKNHFSEREIIDLFAGQGFTLRAKIDNTNRIFHFTR